MKCNHNSILIFSITLLAIYTLFADNCLAQKDSIKIFFQGDFKGETYKVYYNNSILKKIKIKGQKTVSFVLSLDSNIVDGSVFPLSIYKRSRFGFVFRDTFFGTWYNSNKKYLIIFRSGKLKNRFAIEPIWADFPLKFL